eukprot:TRINITY_DN13938_c0_g1_i1.p3 TRINITY_DN13938_c0_g1~~TRINITY_DN13938_c0_g1_i1.p3  ORF type:complete len:262 (-),score=87.26 TRINITY_DN13938_c0_g1_i1:62-847(-)
MGVCTIAPAGPSLVPSLTALQMRMHESGMRRTRNFDTLLSSMGALSQTYDRAVFTHGPPPEPSTNAELLLSVIVVAPELVALIVLLVGTRQWWRRDGWVLLFVLGAGLVSMSGAVALALREAAGAAWRAAAVRDELVVELIPTAEAALASTLNRSLTSLPLCRTESLLLAARTGYRVVLFKWLAIGIVATYLVVSGGVAGGVVWVCRQSRRRRLAAAAAEVEAAAEAEAWGPLTGGGDQLPPILTLAGRCTNSKLQTVESL